MLPVLLELVVPAGLGKPLAVLLAVALVLGRALALVRRERRARRPITFGEALWDDASVVAALAAGIAVLWRAGMLDGRLTLPVHSYGALVAAAFLGGIALAQREARRVGQDAERVSDLAFWLIVAALLGAHLYFALVNWRDFFLADSWLADAPNLGRVVAALTHGAVELRRFPRVLMPGGLVFYGGFIAAALAGAFYLRRHRMTFLPHADTLIPSVALGHFFGRLGCFCAGCCWGDVASSHLPWAARFPPESLAYQSFAAREDPQRFLAPDRLTTLPLHPTQLYEALGELALFLALVLVVRRRKRFQGQILATWLVAYAVLRSFVEAFRGDLERGVVAGLGVGQWTSIAILAAGLAVWARARRERLDPEPATPVEPARAA